MTGWENMSWFFILFAIAGGFLPTIFWLWFWLQEDRRKPEPLRLIMKTFIVGGFFIVPAFALEKFLAPNTNIIELVSNAYRDKSPFWPLIIISSPLIIWAVIEEIIKYLAARIAALKNKQCDEPIDVMIYMITAALGFSAVENFLFLLNILSINTIPLNSLFLTGNLRFLGATLLHIVASAVFGTFLSFAFYRSKIIKTLAWILGLTTATALHVFFNFFIIVNEGDNVLKVLLSIWIIAIFIIFIFEVIKRIHIKTNY
jgi:RsiW-degrading membrane proteinase PrsW (M82 family)